MLKKFFSDIPVWAAKAQIVLGTAAGSLGTLAAIHIPGKSTGFSDNCVYVATLCGVAAVALQFLQRAVLEIEAPAKADQVVDAPVVASENKPV